MVEHLEEIMKLSFDGLDFVLMQVSPIKRPRVSAPLLVGNEEALLAPESSQLTYSGSWKSN